MKKILVTGVNGFVGKSLVEHLIKKGYNITGLTRTKSEKVHSFNVIFHDLSQPLNVTETFDAIVHTAASLPYNHTDFSEFKKNNINATENIIEFAKRNQIKKVIYMSTIAVYGEFQAEIINEDSDIINPDYYGLTKYVGELLVKSEKDIQSISIRVPGIIGKEARGIWLPNTVEKFRRHENVKIYSPEFETKNFVYIDDLVKFICLLIEKEVFERNNIILGCSQGEKVINIVKRIKENTNSNSTIIIDNSIRKSFCIDNANAIKMGYISRTPLEIIDAYCNIILSEK